MAYGETASELAPCSFCGYANWAGAARCLQCGLPVDLVQCPSCEAVNRSDAAICTHCGDALPPIDSSDKPEPRRLLNSSISPPHQLGDTVGSYLGFGVVLAALAFAAYAFFETRSRDVRAETGHSLPSPIELVSTAITTELHPPPFVAIETTPAVTVARATVKRQAQKVHGSQMQESSLALAHAAMDVAPASRQSVPIAAVPTGVGGDVAVPRQTVKQSYCTASAVATNQCRPEQLWTGQ